MSCIMKMLLQIIVDNQKEIEMPMKKTTLTFQVTEREESSAQLETMASK